MPGTPAAAPAPAAARAGAPVLFALLFAAGLLLGRHTVPEGTSLALVSPGAGIAAVWFGLRRRAGARWSGTRWSGALAVDAALLGAAGVAVHLATGATAVLAAAAGAGTLVQTVLFTALLERWCPGAGPGRPLRGARQLVRLLAATGAAVTAGGLLAALVAGHGGAGAAVVLLAWAARDGLAVLLLGCLGLRLLATAGGPRAVDPDVARPPRTAEVLAASLVSAAAYAVQFTAGGEVPLTFLLLVLTVWVALRFCTRTVAWHCLLTGTAAVLFTLHGSGPFAASADPALRALLVQSFAAVGAAIGLVLALGRDERDALLAEVRRQAAAARRQAQSAEMLTGALRSLNAAADAREALCEATARITGADGVYLVEPDGRGELVTRALWGAGMSAVSVAAGEPSLLAQTFRRGEPRFVDDLAGHGGASERLREQLGVTSAAYQPITTADGQTAGLLVSVWRERVEELPAHVRVVMATLALEAAHGMERADLLTQLALAAERDPLTGLANRRRWDEATGKEIARAVRTGLPLSFCLLDLDHFKRYNDTQGHLAGDDLLQEFAAAASGCLREVDTLARWGGEEFVLALPGCSAAGARAVADRIRAVVPRGQTCTVGVAQWQPGLSAAEVIAMADLALYEGKKAGRDVTVVSDVSAAAVVGGAAPAPSPAR
ncbi:diguanylate cyclase [Kineococcus sp. T90]|nr:diguanylate cyclase [Kineococcus indalonis]